MSVADIKQRIPDYAKDIRLNLSAIPRTEGLSKRQLWGTALASAIATRNPDVIAAFTSEASNHLDDAELDAARGAASIMAMNNIYYRFLTLVDDDEYAKLPARLRMHIIGRPGVDKLDFELWCLAVSAITGCGRCVAAHERVLVDGGMGRQHIQNAVRIAAVIHATATVLDNEAANAGTDRAAA